MPPPMALILDYTYPPGMPGVTVELVIFGLMTIFCCATRCDMNLIAVVSCYFKYCSPCDCLAFVLVLVTMFTICSPRILGRLEYQAGSKFYVLFVLCFFFCRLDNLMSPILSWGEMVVRPGHA